jgi:hypothetical protein
MALAAAAGCAVLGGGDDDPGVKNKAKQYTPPSSPFEKVSVSSADEVWQSSDTGSTIAVNSLCRKYQDVSIERLRENILSGIDELKVETTEKGTFDGRDSERVTVSGKTDGIPVTVSILIFKKNGCTYDLAYISRKQNFEKELQLFESFLKGFHVP